MHDPNALTIIALALLCMGLIASRAKRLRP
jgi:hypothetical protein